MAAAVADYRPAEPRADKRPKDREPWAVSLEPTRDVLASSASTAATGSCSSGFAAESGGMVWNARVPSAEQGVDLIVYNDVSREDIGFDATDNEVVLVTAAGERPVGQAPKEQVAAAILDEVERLLEERDGSR
jgi:phosphopantothenoylcysteine synthetase/decarboxylase